MNRTAIAVLSWLSCTLTTGPAQAPSGAAGTAAQADPVAELVAKMQQAEGALHSLVLALRTEGRLPSGLSVTTRGEVHVLRGTQPSTPARLHTRLDYDFADGVRGQIETAWTDGGIVLFEQDPAFGPVYVRIAPSIVADLEWAGRVLGRSDLPGMADGRAQSPLGSGTVAELRRTFDLTIGSRTVNDGEPGTWLVGAAKRGLDERDPDMPLADRVELFVRERDRVLLVARYFVGDDVVQLIEVTRVELDVEIPDATFTVDGRGQRVRDVQLHQPLWEQIEQTITDAEAKSKDGAVRPSRR